jgi:hypothetical protein
MALCIHTQRANRSTQETMHCMQFLTFFPRFHFSDGKTLPIIALLVELEALKPAFAPAPEREFVTSNDKPPELVK